MRRVCGGVPVRRLAAQRPEPQHLGRLTDVGSRRIFGPEHDAIRETARSFFRDHVVPHHAQWEKDGQVSRECWREAGALGLLNTTMPEEYGGLGENILTAAVIWEEQSYTLCTGPGFSLHSEIVSPYILNYGTEEQKQRFLPKLSTGESIGAIAMTEPGAGSDLQGMKTTALPDPKGGTDLLLNGSKTYITNGFMSDVAIVCAKTDPTQGAKGISLVLVEAGMEGFSKGKPLNKMGLKANDTCELFFEDVRIPKENILGPVGAGFKMLMSELPQERLLIADMALAASEAAFEITREFMQDRKAFGKRLIDQQLLLHRMAKAKSELVVGRAFIDNCLELHSQGRLDTATASIAKAAATEIQGRTADEFVQLHGGAGFILDYAVARNYVDARVQRIYGGTNEIMMDLVGRTIK